MNVCMHLRFCLKISFICIKRYECIYNVRIYNLFCLIFYILIHFGIKKRTKLDIKMKKMVIMSQTNNNNNKK